MKRDEIRKLFNDNSDSWEIKNDQSVIPTMTLDSFIEVVEQLQNTSYNSDCAKCKHKKLIACGPDADKCTDCGITFEV